MSPRKPTRAVQLGVTDDDYARMYALNHACNCGRKKHHAPGCPKAKRNR